MRNMRFAAIVRNHTKFEEAVEEIIQYALERIVIDPPKENITVRERDILIDAFMLKLCALWESFLEKEIVLCVSLDARNLIATMELNKRKHLDIKLIRAILFSDKYKSFQDINRVIAFTKEVIIDKYNPFLRINKDQKNKIHFTYSIRNYLSHYSTLSKKKLLSEYKKVFGYKMFLEPSRFLLKNKGRYFEDLASNLKMTSVYMRKIFV